MTAQPFQSEACVLIPAAPGRAEIGLAPLAEREIGPLSRRLTAIDPWARLGVDPARFEAGLRTRGDAPRRFMLTQGLACIGLVVVRYPWLIGPYLNTLAVLPGHQGGGIGAAVLAWLHEEARRASARSTWLCVSAFNARAIAFYTRHGYAPVAVLDDLIVAGEDEILMRRKLA